MQIAHEKRFTGNKFTPQFSGECNNKQTKNPTRHEIHVPVPIHVQPSKLGLNECLTETTYMYIAYSIVHKAHTETLYTHADSMLLH